MAAPEVIAFDSTQQSAYAKAVKKIKKSIVSEEERKASQAKYRRGIILINHLPHGFFENELKGFFKQFGNVTRLRVGRSKKTGRSKGYAFVEFEFEEVAIIAAESMNNYLMFERLIKCQVLPHGVNARKIFASSFGKDNYPTLLRRNKLKEEQSKPLGEDDIKKSTEKRLQSIQNRNKKLAELGIDYTFNLKPSTSIKNIKKVPEDQSAKKQGTKLKNKMSPETAKPANRKSEPAEEKLKTIKFSPKLLRSKKQNETIGQPEKFKKLSPIPVPANPKRKSEGLKSETPKKSKQAVDSSPKPQAIVMKKESRRSEIPEKVPEITKLSPKFLRNARKSEMVEKKDLPAKFSPKMLRSVRKSEGPLSKQEKKLSAQVINKAGKGEGQEKKKNQKTVEILPAKAPKFSGSETKPEKPKFSPKLLRSRTKELGGLPTTSVSVLKRRKSAM